MKRIHKSGTTVEDYCGSVSLPCSEEGGAFTITAIVFDNKLWFKNVEQILASTLHCMISRLRMHETDQGGT